MKPEDYARSESEFSHQVALFMWAALNMQRYPELRWFHAVKNEEKSGSVVLGAKAKSSGVKSGVSDTCLPVRRGNYSGLYIEMKKPNGKPTKEQLDFGSFVTSQGFLFAVCDHWEKAKDVLEKYLLLPKSC